MEQYDGDMQRRLTSALEIYDTITFNDPDNWLNGKAPRPLISLIIGLIILMIYIYFTRERFKDFNDRLKTKHNVRASFRSQMKEERDLFINVLLAATMNCGNAVHTIIYHFAHGFIFLGIFQYHYETGYYILLAFNGIVALWDILQIRLAYQEFDSLHDLINRSGSYILRDGGKKNEEIVKKNSKVIYNFDPEDVYQNVGLEGLVVLMVFISQTILISLVAYDTVENRRITTCLTDGTNGCPTVGTRYSWCLYVLGMFLQCVYLVGPKTNFGRSQLTPTYWLYLLLANKNGAATLSSSMGRETGEKKIHLRKNDWGINARLFMCYIVNGFGFRVLLYTLPIQVASQSSILGIVFRSLGMIYLVNLDDSGGDRLQLEEIFSSSTEEGNKQENKDAVMNYKDAVVNDKDAVVNYHFNYNVSLGLLYDEGKKNMDSPAQTDFIEMSGAIEVVPPSNESLL